jgi:beta-lactamase regulating signal transducer with metallopeptidase domain
MIAYIIKSTISLVVLYGFFHFFLRQYKILIFNRIYLISSLLFSLIIPLIVIPIKTGFSINTTISSITATTNQVIQSKGTMVTSAPHITYETVIVIFFLLISALLLLRFAINIFNLTLKIRRGEKKVEQETTLVLVDDNIIPYSFFRYIFVNRKSYEDGKIERELLLHEEAHCLQYHSIDIIILEIINVFFWFNPAIWLFRKAIQLNHEYYADNRVLTNSDSEDYHRLLINLVIQNNTSYLVSNFKYSLIKNRLIMMTKNRPINSAIFRKIAGTSLFLFLGIVITLGQSNNLTDKIPNRFAKWYTPILKKHNIDLKKYNYINVFTIPKENINSSDTTIFVLLELGTLDLQNDSTITLKNAILISNGPNTGYGIRTAESYSRNLDKDIIDCKEGKNKYYKILLDTVPMHNIPFKVWKEVYALKKDPDTQKTYLGVVATIK